MEEKEQSTKAAGVGTGEPHGESAEASSEESRLGRERYEHLLGAVSSAAPFSRRRFLGWTAGAAAIGLAGCAAPAVRETTTTSAQATTTSAGPTAEHMDREHEEKVKAFPQKTEGLGGQPLKFREEGGVKVFEITCQEADWEYEAGKKAEAWTYNGAVPGPEIRVTEGDRVRVRVKNELPESTSVHWHGVAVPNNQDGVPYITQKPVKPGESFTYDFVAKPPGSHMYHSHHNTAEQVPKGLLGAFIVEPKDPNLYPKADKEYTLIINDVLGGFTINGKSFPATQPLTAKLGQRIRVRFMNEGLGNHPFHVHGLTMDVYARDGYPLPAPFKCDTLDIAPGQRWDVIIDCNNKGVWALHCHILTHAELPTGMFGMVTAIIVE